MPNRVPTTVPLPSRLVSLLEEKCQNEGQLSPSTLMKWVEFRDALQESLQSMIQFAGHNELEVRAQKALGFLQKLSLA